MYIVALLLSILNAATPPATVPSTIPSRPATAPSIAYHSRDNGYSMSLPRGWSAVSQEELANELAANVSASSEAQYMLDAAFYRGDPGSREALTDVQVVPYTSSSEPDADEMRRMMVRFVSADAAARDLTQRGRRLAQPVAPVEPQLDIGARTFSFDAVFPHPAFGRVRQHAVGHFGHSALLVVSCQAPESTFASLEGEFRQIQDSFRFDSVSAYQGGGAQRLNIILITAILAVIYLVFRVNLRKRRRMR